MGPSHHSAQPRIARPIREGQQIGSGIAHLSADRQASFYV
jgi:hypothetical protein